MSWLSVSGWHHSKVQDPEDLSSEMQVQAKGVGYAHTLGETFRVS